MPQFWMKDGRYFVSYVTGPTHNILGLAVSSGISSRDVVMVRLPAVGACGCGPVDGSEIRTAVLAGVADANLALGTDWHPIEIVYVENDSDRYPVYRHCAKLLVERISRGWN